MTNSTHPPTPASGGETGHVCGHDLDPHTLVLIREDPTPMGLAYCPEPGCGCGWTWRANTGPSTREQIAETRRLVRETLIQVGYPIPLWLAG